MKGSLAIFASTFVVTLSLPLSPAFAAPPTKTAVVAPNAPKTYSTNTPEGMAIQQNMIRMQQMQMMNVQSQERTEFGRVLTLKAADKAKLQQELASVNQDLSAKNPFMSQKQRKLLGERRVVLMKQIESIDREVRAKMASMKN